jgi:hypothetical protein
VGHDNLHQVLGSRKNVERGTARQWEVGVLLFVRAVGLLRLAQRSLQPALAHGTDLRSSLCVVCPWGSAAAAAARVRWSLMRRIDVAVLVSRRIDVAVLVRLREAVVAFHPVRATARQ